MSNDVKILVTAEETARRVLHGIAGDLDDLSNHGSALNSIMGTVAKTLGTMAVTGALALGGAIVGGAVSGVKASMELEQALANVQAVLQATGEEAAQLKSLTIDLGLDPKLKVTTLEAANSMEILAKNGISAQDILGGVARATILLSNSTGGNFETAANVATSAMQMFNLKAADMGNIVNGVTGVLNASKFGLTDYEYALANAGGLFGAMGVPLEDFNQLLAAVSTGFATGRTAGTSLKYMLSNLTPVSKTAAEAMRDLGLIATVNNGAFDAANALIAQYSVSIGQAADANLLGPEFDGDALEVAHAEFFAINKDLKEGSRAGEKAFNEYVGAFARSQNVFYDTEGNLKDINSIVGILRTTFGGLNDNDLNTNIRKIFGMEGAPSVIRLIRMTNEEYAAFGDTIDKTDANVQAAIRNNTLEAKLELWGDKLFTLKTLIGDKFSDSFRDLIAGASAALDEATPAILNIYSWLAKGFEDTVPMIVSGLNTVAELISAIGNQHISIDSTGIKGDMSNDDSDKANSLVADWSTGALHAKLKLGDLIDLETDSDMLQLKIGSIFRAGFKYGMDNSLVTLDGVFDFTSVAGKIHLTVGDAFSVAWDRAAGYITASLPGVFNIEGSVNLWSAQIAGVFKAMKIGDSIFGQIGNLNVDWIEKQLNVKLGNSIDYTLDVGGIVSSIQNSAKYVRDTLELSYRIDGWRGVAATIAGMTDTLVDDTIAQIQANISTMKPIKVGTDTLGFTIDVAGVISEISGTANKVRAALELAYSLDGWQGVARMIAGVGGLVFSSAMATLKTNISTIVGNVFGDATTLVQNVDAAQISAAINTVVGVVVDASTALAGVKSEGIISVTHGVLGLVTSLTTLDADVLKGINVQKIGQGIGNAVTSAAQTLQSSADPKLLSSLGSAIGNLFNVALGKAGELLATPDLGKDVGESVGSIIGTIIVGTDALVNGFANELAHTQWDKYEDQLGQFITGLLGGLITGAGKALLKESIFDPQTRQHAIDQYSDNVTTGRTFPIDVTGSASLDSAIMSFLIGTFKNLQDHENRFPAPEGSNKPYLTAEEYARTALASRGVDTSQSQTPQASTMDWLTGVGLAIAGPIVDAIVTMKGGGVSGTVMGMPLLNMGVPTFDLGGQAPTVDVTANVTNIQVPLADVLRPPMVDVVARISDVDTSQWRSEIWQNGMQGFADQFGQNGKQSGAGPSAPAAANSDISLPAWPPYPIFTWPDLPSWIWPEVPQPTWISDLRVPEPSWLDDLLSWSPNLGSAGGNAAGTGFWQGGWSWVGENGPELVNVPHGSTILSNRESQDAMGGGVTVIVQATVNNDIDVERLAHRVADITERKRRR